MLEAEFRANDLAYALGLILLAHGGLETKLIIPKELREIPTDGWEVESRPLESGDVEVRLVTRCVEEDKRLT